MLKQARLAPTALTSPKQAKLEKEKESIWRRASLRSQPKLKKRRKMPRKTIWRTREKRQSKRQSKRQKKRKRN